MNQSHAIPRAPVVICNGASIPAYGIGTWDLRGAVAARVVEQALDRGVRHVDTARMYGNEREVGAGIRASRVARSEIFLTTKILPRELRAADAIRAAEDSLATLDIEYIDLLLIHWPNARVPLAETLGAMAKMKQAGFVRELGVSNFTVALLDEAKKVSPEPLVCDQTECHPFLDQHKVIAACRAQGMAVVAYSPIARGNVRGNEVLERIGKAHGKSAAQVCLRFLVQQGIVVIPRTSKIERLEENFALFDFALSQAEMTEIGKLARRNDRIVDWSWLPNWD
jgi:2,5-diketo-D-gluconate reductase B